MGHLKLLRPPRNNPQRRVPFHVLVRHGIVIFQSVVRPREANGAEWKTT